MLVNVRPFTGARIETPPEPPPSRRCSVRPFTGARIETDGKNIPHDHPHRVRPFTGARIETNRGPAKLRRRFGSPLHGGAD